MATGGYLAIHQLGATFHHLSFSDFSCQSRAGSVKSDHIIIRLSESPDTNYVMQ